MSTTAEFVEAVRTLHREKDRAYGNAWKRRGELVSVIANLARKVDRLERLINDEASSTRDESAIDTAVDLFVYCLKYQTFLADLDEALGERLFDNRLAPPYSDGVEAFEALLDQADLSALDGPAALAAQVAAATVVTVFANLEDSLAADGLSPARRQQSAADLAAAALVLVAAWRAADPSGFEDFVGAWSKE